MNTSSVNPSSQHQCHGSTVVNRVLRVFERRISSSIPVS